MLSPAGEDEYCLDEIIAMRNLLGSTSWCHFGDGINIYDGSFHIDTFAAEMNLTMFDSLTNISTPNPAKCDAIMMKISLHHIMEVEPIAAMWHRTLTPGGKLLILDHFPFKKVFGEHSETVNGFMPVWKDIWIPLHIEWNPINYGHAMIPDDVIKQVLPNHPTLCPRSLPWAHASQPAARSPPRFDHAAHTPRLQVHRRLHVEVVAHGLRAYHGEGTQARQGRMRKYSKRMPALRRVQSSQGGVTKGLVACTQCVLCGSAGVPRPAFCVRVGVRECEWLGYKVKHKNET